MFLSLELFHPHEQSYHVLNTLATQRILISKRVSIFFSNSNNFTTLKTVYSIFWHQDTIIFSTPSSFCIIHFSLEIFNISWNHISFNDIYHKLLKFFFLPYPGSKIFFSKNMMRPVLIIILLHQFLLRFNISFLVTHHNALSN